MRPAERVLWAVLVVVAVLALVGAYHLGQRARADRLAEYRPSPVVVLDG